MNKYSKIYWKDKKKISGFRYDYERAVLEWIFVDGDEIEAVDSYGLSKENWKK